MYKFQRLMEKIGSIVIVVIIVGFSIGFGILVKKELIDRDFSSDVEKVQDKNEDNEKTAVENKKEETKEDKKEESEQKKEENVSNDKEDNNVSGGDYIEYKVYPIISCSAYGNLEGTNLKQSEIYTAHFNNDGSLKWMEYSYVIDFTNEMAAYNELAETGFFEELYNEIKDVGEISYNPTNIKMSYELEEDDFLSLDSDDFKTKNDLKYESLKRIFINTGYNCKEE